MLHNHIPEYRGSMIDKLGVLVDLARHELSDRMDGSLCRIQLEKDAISKKCVSTVEKKKSAAPESNLHQ